MLPSPVNLEVLAKTLNVEPGDLMPTVVPGVRNDPIPFELRSLPDGRMFLRIAQPVSQQTALKKFSTFLPGRKSNSHDHRQVISETSGTSHR